MTHNLSNNKINASIFFSSRQIIATRGVEYMS